MKAYKIRMKLSSLKPCIICNDQQEGESTAWKLVYTSEGKRNILIGRAKFNFNVISKCWGNSKFSQIFDLSMAIVFQLNKQASIGHIWRDPRFILPDCYTVSI